MSGSLRQLVSYIAPGAPATRRPAEGDEPLIRLELGFTPAWFRQHEDIDFGEVFHTKPEYRKACVKKMRAIIRDRFPSSQVGGIDKPDAPLDLLTGTFGACTVAAIYGIPIIYDANNWPNCSHEYLNDEQVANLQPPELDRNPHFAGLMAQVDWIERQEGRVTGFINWQGILNNAFRLRGESVLTDMLVEPERSRHLFDCVCETMIEGILRLHERQRASGVDMRFVTVSNCMVNLVSPELYSDLLLPFDQKLAALYGTIGIHNCAWTATPYFDSYTQVPGVAYIDMGLHSDLARARKLFPAARRALMYTPMDAMNKPWPEIETDFQMICREYGPCDVVVADLEAGTPDERVRALIDLCKRLSKQCAATT